MNWIAYLLLAVPLLSGAPAQEPPQQPAKRLEELQGKTILLFTPHPDDDVFGAGGTITLLNRNHNKVFIVVYTNDDKGSYDPEMTSQRLARIRRAEQEASEGLLGTPNANIIWMGYDDEFLFNYTRPDITAAELEKDNTRALASIGVAPSVRKRAAVVFEGRNRIRPRDCRP